MFQYVHFRRYCPPGVDVREVYRMVVDSDPGPDLLLTSYAIWILEPANISWVVKQRRSTEVDNIIMENSSEKRKT